MGEGWRDFEFFSLSFLVWMFLAIAWICFRVNWRAWIFFFIQFSLWQIFFLYFTRPHPLGILIVSRVLATKTNQKQDLFSFYMPWRYHICIDKCQYSYGGGLPEIWTKPPPKNFRWKVRTRISLPQTSRDIQRNSLTLLFTFHHSGFNILCR